MTYHFNPSGPDEDISRAISAPRSQNFFPKLRSEILKLAAAYDLSGNRHAAQTVTFAVATAVWRSAATRTQSQMSIRSPFVVLDISPLPHELAEAVAEFAHLASKSDPVLTAFELGQIYSSLLPPADRKSGGVHYTPPHIAGELILQARKQYANFTTGRVLEPSAGGGVLLVSALEELLFYSGIYEEALLIDLPKRLVGLEIDPFAAWLAQIAVDIRLLPLAIRHGLDLPRVVQVTNSLHEVFDEEFDVVLMNPPFGRAKLTAAQREQFARSLFGHANIYGLFLDLGLRAVKSEGIVTALTPTSFLGGEYFKNLRSMLRTGSTIRNISILDTRCGVFEDVQQELVLTTIQKTKSSRPVQVAKVEIDKPQEVVVDVLGEFKLPDDLSAPWLIPRTRDQVNITRGASSLPHRLSDWGYSIKTGPVVWNRFRSLISERPQTDSLPLIWAGCVRPNGIFEWPATTRKGKAWIRLQENQQHFSQKDPCVLLQRTTSREQKRRLVATPLPFSMINNHGAVVIENHVQVLEPTSKEPPVSSAALTAFLNSQTADTVFRCFSGSASVSAYELRALLLPDPKDLGRLEALVADLASSKEIEREIQRLYREE
ncbi:Eco57I restriction-modification methylase domain-containing protein [Shimia thalassica]|uniref:HsdM family class I SAM-dependent methyltransferase n=1 Tax=Shimia thalassica TaxID=1715693 RepID=UPI002732C24F|nr:Eco57I restriction-modification methylase domain-containing protein [Shimia thalassica]MDP2582102.1 Eco57I restriction-modification methylase domain-containing protein [Shimia thalassica]